MTAISAPEQTMQLHGVQAAQESGKPKNPPKEAAQTKSEIQPRTVIDLYKQRESNPDSAILNERSKTPEITDSTKITAGDALVRQYMAIKDVIKTQGADLTKPPLKDFADFINNFETSFESQEKQSIANANPSEADLKRFARGLVENDKYMLWAIKIAESQQAVLQAVTGARIDVPSDNPEPKFIPEMYAHGPASLEAITKAHLKSGDKWTTKMVNTGKDIWHALMQPADLEEYFEWLAKRRFNGKRSTQDAQDMYNIFLLERQKAAENPLQTTTYVYFEDGDDQKVNLKVKINGRVLDPVQMALLKRYNVLGTQMYQGAELTAPAAKVVSDMLTQITNARLNFYNHLGYEMYSANADEKANNPKATDDFNVVDSINRPTALTPAATRDFRTGSRNENHRIVLDKLGYDQWSFRGAHGSREVLVGARSLGAQLKVIETGLSESLKEVRAKKDQELSRNAMQFHIDQLKADVQYADGTEKPQDESVAHDIDTRIDKDGLKFWNERKDLLTKRTGIEKSIADATKTVTEMDTRLQSESPIKDASGNPLKYEDLRTISKTVQMDYEDAKDAEADLQTETDNLETDYQRMISRHKEIKDRIQHKDSKVRDAVSAEDKATYAKLSLKIDGDNAGTRPFIEILNQKRADLKAAKTETKKKQKAVNAANEEIGDLVKLADGWAATKRQSQLDLAQKNIELNELKAQIGDKLKIDPKQPAEYSEKDIQTKIEELTRKKELSLHADRFKLRQLAVYEELKQRTDPETYEAMRNRAEEPLTNGRKDLLQRAITFHPTYPVAYLKAIQDIYTTGVTEPQAAEEFTKATRLVTLDTFVRVLQNRGLPITGPTDPRLQSADLLNQVDKKFISSVFTDLLRQASTGELGKTSEQDKAMLEVIDKTKAIDIKDYKEAEDNKVQEFVVEASKAALRLDQIVPLVPNVQGVDAQVASGQIKDLIKQNVALPDAITQFSALQNTIPADQAKKFVETVYGMYESKKEAISASSEIMKISMNQKYNLEDATTLATASQIIEDRTERQRFLALVEKGMNIEQIMDTIGNYPPAQQRLYRDVILLFTSRNILNAAPHSFQDFNNNIRFVLELHKQRVNNIAPGAPLPPEINTELTKLLALIDAMEQRQEDRMYTGEMDAAVLVEGTVEEVTLWLLKMHNESITNANLVASEKMYAQEIVKRRDQQKRRTMAQAPQAKAQTAP